jgi:sugar (pentulose or hexulose) kinase
MLAAAGAGLYPSVAAAAAAMSRQGGAPLQPRAAEAAVYASAYDRYRAVYDALRPVFAA